VLQVRRHTGMVAGPLGLAIDSSRPLSSSAERPVAPRPTGAGGAVAGDSAVAGSVAEGASGAAAAAAATESPALPESRARNNRRARASAARSASAASAPAAAPAEPPFSEHAQRQAGVSPADGGMSHAAPGAELGATATPTTATADGGGQQVTAAAAWPPHTATPGLAAVLRWASELLDAQLGALVGRADAAEALRELQVGP
jgi:DNA polymerase-3 subunit gamma/tau